MKITELLSEAEAPTSIGDLAKAIADAISHSGTRIFDVEEFDDDQIHFAIEFDFPEGFIKGSEVKKASKEISKVFAEKSPNWRHGETGADYIVTVKAGVSASELAAELKKLVK